MLAYLSGSIEYSPDLGKGWRAELTPFLRGLGHEVYDQALDERKNLTDDEVRSFRAWKETDLPRYQATLRKIIAWDLDWVERSDYVVCLWDGAAARGAGTQGELTYAHRLGRPVYLVRGLPVGEISGWVLGCATTVLDSFATLREVLAARHRSAPSLR